MEAKDNFCACPWNWFFLKTVCIFGVCMFGVCMEYMLRHLSFSLGKQLSAFWFLKKSVRTVKKVWDRLAEIVGMLFIWGHFYYWPIVSCWLPIIFPLSAYYSTIIISPFFTVADWYRTSVVAFWASRLVSYVYGRHNGRGIKGRFGRCNRRDNALVHCFSNVGHDSISENTGDANSPAFMLSCLLSLKAD